MTHYIFFDIDGTLHKQDLLFDFVLFALYQQWLITLLFLPFILMGAMIYFLFPKLKIGINIIFYFLFLGMTENQLNCLVDEFYHHYKNKLTPFPKVLDKLNSHLNNRDTVIFITGSLDKIIIRFYQDYLDKGVILIASDLKTYYGSYIFNHRCYADNKLILLDAYFKQTIYFKCGYSDSKADLPVLNRCQTAYWIKDGQVIPRQTAND